MDFLGPDYWFAVFSVSGFYLVVLFSVMGYFDD